MTLRRGMMRIDMTPKGLTTGEAANLRARFGPNELRRQAPTPLLTLLARQIMSPMIGLLAVAAIVSIALHERADAIAIGAIVVLNAVVGFLQEHRAERAIFALRALTAPRARVLRDGHVVTLAASEIVPGDVLVLEAGDIVAADATLAEAHELSANEAILTGESMPAPKSTEPAATDAPLAEQRHRIFLGTSIATGTGLAEVSATGMATEMGRIAHLLEGAEQGDTPLKAQLERVGRSLVIACVGLVALVFALETLRGEPLLSSLLTAVALAVAAVPEGLPAIVTVALAVGVERMAGRQVLVRRLHAVETLGSSTVICSDKTGTLTTGIMAVRDLWGMDRHALLYSAAACCDAELQPGGGGAGDPAEIAILRAAAERGITRDDIEREAPRVRVRPFSSDTRSMAIVRKDGRVHVKGALESLLPHVAGTDAGSALAAALDMGARGLRVLAVARGQGPGEEGLTLLGLIGLADPPRPEAIEALDQARRAGVQTIMITGDHATTAQAIAREMGLLREGDDPEYVVRARVTAEDKLRMVKELQAAGHVVAMTGDGVNDAPALRAADVGVAMGRNGTEVTREAADVVLVNDDYTSIVAAVREGRAIFDNIQKTLQYLLSGNIGEIGVMLVAALVGLPLPLLPLQLLWINLVTDGLPALALVMDPPDRDVLARPPRRRNAPMLGRDEWAIIIGWGVLDATVVITLFAWTYVHQDLAHARSIAFASLVFIQLFRPFAVRSRTRLFWQVGPLTNLKLIGVIVVSIGLQLALHWVPWLAEPFGATPLGAREILLCVGAGLIPVSATEIAKLISGRWRSR